MVYYVKVVFVMKSLVFKLPSLLSSSLLSRFHRVTFLGEKI